MICRVVVCSTVSVVTTVVGSDVDSIVVVPAAWTLPTTAVARTIPATRQATSPASCSDFLTRQRIRLPETQGEPSLAAQTGGPGAWRGGRTIVESISPYAIDIAVTKVSSPALIPLTV